jgi:hypothetical protein
MACAACGSLARSPPASWSMHVSRLPRYSKCLVHHKRFRLLLTILAHVFLASAMCVRYWPKCLHFLCCTR